MNPDEQYWLDKLPPLDRAEFDHEILPLIEEMSGFCQAMHEKHDSSCFAKVEATTRRLNLAFDAWKLSAHALTSESWHQQVEAANAQWAGVVTTDAATVDELRSTFR